MRALPTVRTMAVALSLALSLAEVAHAQELPELTLDAGATTASGLSSGGFMAVQLQVAFSESIAGAGIVAGGPYFCSRGDVLTALNQCMQIAFGPPDSGFLLSEARRFAAAGEIDALSGLEDDRVYLFSGTQDRTVTRRVMDAARNFYLAAGVPSEAIRYVTDVPAGHAFISEAGSGSCSATQPNFINDCDIDQAGDILGWLYRELDPPVPPDPARLVEFDQSAFLRNPESHGMDVRGFAYVPEACAAGETCRLHIVFHGCEQTPDQIGDLYARTTGYNRWAEANGIVVLYPQAQIVPSPLFDPLGGNPKGCWDWWGYDDANFAVRRGHQMAAVAGMAARLGAPLGEAPDPGNGPGGGAFCRRHDGFNQEHLLMGRAFFCGFGVLCAWGSGEIIGPPFLTETLFESPAGRFSRAPCD